MSKALLNTLHTAYRVDFEAAKALVERAAGEKRDLSAEEEAQYARLNESMNEAKELKAMRANKVKAQEEADVTYARSLCSRAFDAPTDQIRSGGRAV